MLFARTRRGFFLRFGVEAKQVNDRQTIGENEGFRKQ